MMVVAGSYEEYRSFCRNRDIDPLAHTFVQDVERMKNLGDHGVVVYYGTYAMRIPMEMLARIRKLCIARRHFCIVDQR